MPGKPELQKLLWNWRQMFACHTCPVCRLSGACAELGFVWKTSLDFIERVLPQEKEKQVTHFPAKSSRWAQPQAQETDDIQAHKKWVCKGRVAVHPSTPPASATGGRGEGTPSKLRFSSPCCSNTSAFLQIKKDKASFPPGRASLKHSVCLELSSQELFLGYFPLLNYLIRSLCNQLGLEILFHSLQLQSQCIARVSKTWNCVACNSQAYRFLRARNSTAYLANAEMYCTKLPAERQPSNKEFLIVKVKILQLFDAILRRGWKSQPKICIKKTNSEIQNLILP